MNSPGSEVYYDFEVEIITFFLWILEMRALIINLFLLCFVFGLGFPERLSAEEIDHHGQLVEIDAESGCVDCHDEMEDHTHPVLIEYPPPGKESNFAPPSTLAASGVSLINGQVICVSCHNLRNKSPGHLITGNKKSRMCLICHIK